MEKEKSYLDTAAEIQAVLRPLNYDVFGFEYNEGVTTVKLTYKPPQTGQD
jgi:hypothetical protein